MRTERYKRSFFPSTTKTWNNIDLEIRESDTIGSFKRVLVNYYNVPEYFLPFDYALDRYSSVIHTRLRLDVCALNYYLFKIAVKSSPLLMMRQNWTHFFLRCPNYAAWFAHCCCSYCFRSMHGLDILTNSQFGSTELTINGENIENFSDIQHFIRESNRFSFFFFLPL